MGELTFAVWWWGVGVSVFVAWGLLRLLSGRANWIRGVDWIGLNGSEEIFRLLSEQIERSWRGLSVAEGSE